MMGSGSYRYPYQEEHDMPRHAKAAPMPPPGITCSLIPAYHSEYEHGQPVDPLQHQNKHKSLPLPAKARQVPFWLSRGAPQELHHHLVVHLSGAITDHHEPPSLGLITAAAATDPFTGRSTWHSWLSSEAPAWVRKEVGNWLMGLQGSSHAPEARDTQPWTVSPPSPELSFSSPPPPQQQLQTPSYQYEYLHPREPTLSAEERSAVAESLENSLEYSGSGLGPLLCCPLPPRKAYVPTAAEAAVSQALLGNRSPSVSSSSPREPRYVGLLGPGGAGKTAAAAAAVSSASVRRAFPGGIVWLDVEALARSYPGADASVLVCRALAEQVAQLRGCGPPWPPLSLVASGGAGAPELRAWLGVRVANLPGPVLLVLDGVSSPEQVRGLAALGASLLIAASCRSCLSTAPAPRDPRYLRPLPDVPPSVTCSEVNVGPMEHREALVLLLVASGCHIDAEGRDAAADVVLASGRLPMEILLLGAVARLRPGQQGLVCRAADLQVLAGQLWERPAGSPPACLLRSFDFAVRELHEPDGALYRRLGVALAEPSFSLSLLRALWSPRDKDAMDVRDAVALVGRLEQRDLLQREGDDPQADSWRLPTALLHHLSMRLQRDPSAWEAAERRYLNFTRNRVPSQQESPDPQHWRDLRPISETLRDVENAKALGDLPLPDYMGRSLPDLRGYEHQEELTRSQAAPVTPPIRHRQQMQQPYSQDPPTLPYHQHEQRPVLPQELPRTAQEPSRTAYYRCPEKPDAGKAAAAPMKNLEREFDEVDETASRVAVIDSLRDMAAQALADFRPVPASEPPAPVLPRAIPIQTPSAALPPRSADAAVLGLGLGRLLPQSSELRSERPEPPLPEQDIGSVNASMADLALPSAEVPPRTPSIKLERQLPPSQDTESVYIKASTDTSAFPVAKSPLQQPPIMMQPPLSQDTKSVNASMAAVALPPVEVPPQEPLAKLEQQEPQWSSPPRQPLLSQDTKSVNASMAAVVLPMTEAPPQDPYADAATVEVGEASTMTAGTDTSVQVSPPRAAKPDLESRLKKVRHTNSWTTPRPNEPSHSPLNRSMESCGAQSVISGCSDASGMSYTDKGELLSIMEQSLRDKLGETAVASLPPDPESIGAGPEEELHYHYHYHPISDPGSITPTRSPVEPRSPVSTMINGPSPLFQTSGIELVDLDLGQPGEPQQQGGDEEAQDLKNRSIISSSSRTRVYESNSESYTEPVPEDLTASMRQRMLRVSISPNVGFLPSDNSKAPKAEPTDESDQSLQAGNEHPSAAVRSLSRKARGDVWDYVHGAVQTTPMDLPAGEAKRSFPELPLPRFSEC